MEFIICEICLFLRLQNNFWCKTSNMEKAFFIWVLKGYTPSICFETGVKPQNGSVIDGYNIIKV